MNQKLSEIGIVICGIAGAILLICVFVIGAKEIYSGITDFNKPGGKPIELIIEGLKTLSVIGVAYLLLMHVFKKK